MGKKKIAAGKFRVKNKFITTTHIINFIPPLPYHPHHHYPLLSNLLLPPPSAAICRRLLLFLTSAAVRHSLLPSAAVFCHPPSAVRRPPPAAATINSSPIPPPTYPPPTSATVDHLHSNPSLHVKFFCFIPPPPLLLPPRSTKAGQDGTARCTLQAATPTSSSMLWLASPQLCAVVAWMHTRWTHAMLDVAADQSVVSPPSPPSTS